MPNVQCHCPHMEQHGQMTDQAYQRDDQPDSAGVVGQNERSPRRSASCLSASAG